MNHSPIPIVTALMFAVVGPSFYQPLEELHQTPSRQCPAGCVLELLENEVGETNQGEFLRNRVRESTVDFILDFNMNHVVTTV